MSFKIRLDWLTAGVFWFALFLTPEVPGWYMVLEQILGWVFVAFMVVMMVVGVLAFNGSSFVKTTLKDMDVTAAAKTSKIHYVAKLLFAWMLLALIGYSGYVQGFNVFVPVFITVAVLAQIMGLYTRFNRRTLQARLGL